MVKERRVGLGLVLSAAARSIRRPMMERFAGLSAAFSRIHRYPRLREGTVDALASRFGKKEMKENV